MQTHKAFVDAFQKLPAHPKLAEIFILGCHQPQMCSSAPSVEVFQMAHGQAMHYFNQYLQVYGLCAAHPATDASHPLHNIYQALQSVAPSVDCQTALQPALLMLERVMLNVAVLSLVLKVVY